VRERERVGERESGGPELTAKCCKVRRVPDAGHTANSSPCARSRTHGELRRSPCALDLGTRRRHYFAMCHIQGTRRTFF